MDFKWNIRISCDLKKQLKRTLFSPSSKSHPLIQTVWKTTDPSQTFLSCQRYCKTCPLTVAWSPQHCLIHISQLTELVTALKLLYWKLSTISSLFLTMERFLCGLSSICLPHSIPLTTKFSFLALNLPTVSGARPFHCSDPILSIAAKQFQSMDATHHLYPWSTGSIKIQFWDQYCLSCILSLCRLSFTTTLCCMKVSQMIHSYRRQVRCRISDKW